MRKWLSISAVIVALDLYTKHLIQNAFVYAEHYVVTPFFDLVRYHNEGAAFSFLAGAGGWQKVFFSIVAIVASIVIVNLMRKAPQQKLFCFALALVLGGALGNLYDRLTLGYVVDFLAYHYHGRYRPAFNVADSASVAGVLLLIWASIKKPSSST